MPSFSSVLRLVYLAILLPIASVSAQVSTGLLDDFQDGSTQNWRQGINSGAVVTVSDLGPQGAGDFALQVTSTGTGGIASKLTVFNTAQWTGNYTAAGVETISASVNNLGATDLILRVWLEGPGGRWVSASGFSLPAGSGWQQATFSVRPADLAPTQGATSVSTTLAGVTKLRIYHSPTPTTPGTTIAATLALDNIAAGPPPSFDFIVNSAYERPDTNLGDGQCFTGFSVVVDGITTRECTLRAAIEEANAQGSTGPSAIHFDIDDGPAGSEIAPGVWKITVSSPTALPEITAPDLVIDGLTQPGASCGDLVAGQPHDLRVVLDGSLLTDPSASGLVGFAPRTTVRGLVVQNFSFYGIFLERDANDDASHLAECNYVGSDHTGQAAAGNLIGLFVYSGTIQNNLASANSSLGLGGAARFAGDSLLIRRNIVGADIDGSQALGNGTGIAGGVSGGAGDMISIHDNLISGNGDDGVRVGGAEVIEVVGNIVGLALDRTTALGNGARGIAFSHSSSSAVDPSVTIQNNLVGSNEDDGISVFSPSSDLGLLLIEGNTVGLNDAGTARPNGDIGVSVFGGSNASVLDNVVSVRDAGGIVVAGISVINLDAALVEGNTVGLNAAGAARPNEGIGITVQNGIDHVVRANTVANSLDDGLFLFNADNALIEGNTVGLNDAGDLRPNARNGIEVRESDGVTLRDNMASGNTWNGIALSFSPNATIEGNTVGLNASGDIRPNGVVDGFNNSGISIFGSDNLTLTGNVVSGNSGSGIFFEQPNLRADGDRGQEVGRSAGGFVSSAPVITGNFVGTTADGLAARPNGQTGLVFSESAADALVQANTLSGNTDNGVFLFNGTSGHVFENNFIGTNAEGDDLGNGPPSGAGRAGIFCSNASDVRIGQNFSPNRIYFNGGDGIFIGAPCQDIAVVGNIIRDNGDLAVDLAPNGPNPNDTGDGDTGANGKLNFPVITSAENDGSNSIIEWTLNAEANTTYELLFCRVSSPDPSGYGECANPNALATTTTNGASNASGTETLGVGAYPAGSFVTVNATEVAGAIPEGYRATSEFALSVEVEDTGVMPGIFLTATNTSPLTVAPSGQISFDYTITNNTAASVTGDFFFRAERNGSTVAQGMILSGTLPAGQMVTSSFTQQVPGSAPAGSYAYSLRIGQFPNVAVDQEDFAVVVSGSAREGDSEGWAVLEAKPWVLAEDTASETSAAEAASSEALPTEASLSDVYPNPFSRETTVAFALPEAGRVTLAVYDVLGREVVRLVDDERRAGRYEVVLDGADLPSGVYLVRMTASGFAATRRVTLLR